MCVIAVIKGFGHDLAARTKEHGVSENRVVSFLLIEV